jgi:hypothetical protein
MAGIALYCLWLHWNEDGCVGRVRDEMDAWLEGRGAAGAVVGSAISEWHVCGEKTTGQSNRTTASIRVIDVVRIKIERGTHKQ